MINYKDKYLNLLKQRYKLFPQKINDFNRKMGVELEFHIVPLNGKEPDNNILKNLLNEMLLEFEFEPIEKDNEGNFIKGKKDEDIIGYECSYSMLEISIAPHLNIHEISKKSNYYINKIQKYLKRFDLTLLSLGINPFEWGVKIPFMNTNYLNILQYLFEDYNLNKKYSFKNTTSFISAIQLHLDLSLEELPIYFNILNKLGWVKALLFANSPNIINKTEKCNCLRDLLWEDCSLGYNETNVGDKNNAFASHEEVFLDTLENSIYYVKRDSKSIYFQPKILKEYLSSKSILGYKIQDGEKIQVEIIPDLSDIQYSRPYNSIVIRNLGTVEIRSECSQPFDDMMSHLAFHLGIVNNLDKIKNHLSSTEDKIKKSSYKQLRKIAIFEDYDIQKYLEFDIEKFIYELLILIKDGLISRNMQEEIYLNCLFDRLKNKSNPAIEWMNKLNNGYTPIEIINEAFSQKETICV